MLLISSKQQNPVNFFTLSFAKLTIQTLKQLYSDQNTSIDINNTIQYSLSDWFIYLLN